MLKFKLKKMFNLFLKKDYKKYIKKYFLLKKIAKTERYTATNTEILGTEIELVDSASFLFMYQEIFQQEIYRFKTEKRDPVIIDCGANIGLSIIYFKQIYPESHIIAFEPDSQVFNTLKKNIDSCNLSNVQLINKAVWDSETTLDFMSEGADAGRVVELDYSRQINHVPTVRLSQYLKQPIDFLKLDIEGAETEVIQECKDYLSQVLNLFIEYHSFVNQPQTLPTIINILSEAGFRLHIHPPVTSPQPFYERNIHLGMDMQLNIFAFRE